MKELKINKASHISNRLSPDTPSANPLTSELQDVNMRFGVFDSKERRKSKDSANDLIESPLFGNVKLPGNQDEQKE